MCTLEFMCISLLYSQLNCSVSTKALSALKCQVMHRTVLGHTQVQVCAILAHLTHLKAADLF